MLCSHCKKNTAVLFYNKIENNEEIIEGYCFDCAEKKGLDPAPSITAQRNAFEPSPEDLSNMKDHLEELFKDLSENLDFNEIDNIEGAISFTNTVENNDGMPEEKVMGAAIPLGSLFSNRMHNKSEFQTKKLDKKKKETKKGKKYLDSFGTNLSFKAKNNELDMVIGRDLEIERMTQILNRRSKNNPCLIGEPGVGKTSIAQGLALRINSQNVPAKLLDKEVYLLDMTAVIAGTQFRGQFESRIKNIVDECKTLGNIILVIDEIHNIMGAGDGEHSMNAANLLKPALSNGDIQLIGTTTIKEYRKHIEKDSALERRFQPILIEEPSIDDSIGILSGIKKYYETFHRVSISEDIIQKTVEMSEKYIHDRNLPDKAIDILDEACSKINLENKDLYKLEILKQELDKIRKEKEEVVATDSSEDYEKAAELKKSECSLMEKIDTLNSKINLVSLTTEHIANVIESWTKIPVKKITEAETQKLLSLEANLRDTVIGQNEAVSAVSRAIRRNRAGLQNTKRPPSFIFVGPTGVGKTQLAKSLAFEMFGSSDSIIRIDMSEFMEGHSSSKLIGAPPRIRWIR